GPNFPHYKDPAAVKAACDTGLAQAQQDEKALGALKVDAGWLRAYDKFGAALEDAGNSLDFLQYVAVEGPMRDAAQACSLRWSEFYSSLLQNEALYKGLKAAPVADAIDRELVRVALTQFETAGVALPKDKRERAKAILDKITGLDQQFNKNIRDAGTKVLYTEAELKGVPEGVWKTAKRTADGHIELGVDYPSYIPVLTLADSGAVRQRAWLAKTNEGGQANLKIMAEIVKLRHEYAGLFGYSNFVDFNLRFKMAKDGATALKFLGDVKAAVASGEKADLEVLREAKAKQLGTKLADTKVERWDATYYTERVRRERFAVDQEAFRPYFPPEPALQFCLRVIEKMMGVRYTLVKNQLWHADAQTYVVTDVATGKQISQLYVDLFPRDGKYNHAAVWPLRSASTLTGRTPIAALVVNFNRKGLTLDEMETLLHELGHAVHTNLSAVRYAALSNNGIQHDFVEAPSQMLEDWVYDKKVLKVMTEVCPTCQPVPDTLIDKAKVAKQFGKPTQFARQHLYASYDLALHGPDTPDPLALWAKMEGATPLGYVKGTMFPAGFAHLTSSYGAGYYGYLWSLVVATDLRTPFKADKLSPEVGMRYRQTVLSQGAQKPAAQLVHDFLGRDSSAKAFFEELKK
ncbi:MAG TPA: M3 family metallopeptidase, partial [Burkholderiaceae bacterium]